jgi:SAM-dependent methyltransferase
VNVSGFLLLGVAGYAGWWLARQCRRPIGWLGRVVVRDMNARHAALLDWTLAAIDVRAATARGALLEVGCGGGHAITRLAREFPTARIHGLDYSAASVAVARTENAAALASGQVQIAVGSVSTLPFASDTMGLVLAMETHYYWPNIAEDLREIARVLCDNGVVALGVESYRGKRLWQADAAALRWIGGRVWSAAEHRALLVAAGFVDVRVDADRAKGWLRALGRKPDAGERAQRDIASAV